MKLILPMAGDSARFQGIAKGPKYLIEVKGKPMLHWGLLSCEFRPEEIVAVVRQDHCTEFDVEEKIRVVAGTAAKIVKVGATRGAAETVLMGLAEGNCTSGEPIAIKDVDCISAPPKGWRAGVEAASKKSKTPIVWVGAHEDRLEIAEKNTNKSHLRLSAEGNILEIREKVRLSPWFVAGWYLFSSAAVFAEAAREILERPSSGECYLSHVVARVLQQGGAGKILAVREYHDLGTPSALQTYLQ